MRQVKRPCSVIVVGINYHEVRPIGLGIFFMAVKCTSIEMQFISKICAGQYYIQIYDSDAE